MIHWEKKLFNYVLECTVNDNSSNLSYSIFTKHCTDSAVGVKSSILKNENVQTGIRFSYQSFSFVRPTDDTDVTMKLKCTVSYNLHFYNL